ncbi:MAG: FAD-dependent thymidylate synthase [Candidatus Spyradocola sp.]
MAEQHLNVTLIAHTPEPEKVIAMASRTCYSALDLSGLDQKTDATDNAAYIRRVLASGHTSIAEHASFTFGLEGVSRTLLAQITRHRVASFSVQSQRYVSVAGAEVFDYVLPPRIRALGPEAVEKFAQQMKTMQRWYDEWSEALGQDSAEDARFVLPGAAATRIVMTMNARELLHFFSLRMCNRAQWEVREAAWRMYELVYPLAPSVFELAGPGCARGACPEGKRSCGRAAEVRQKLQGLREKP